MDTVLDVKIDNLKRNEILQKVEIFLSEDKFHQIATINPEFILEAQKNPEFKNILNGCDLNVADGMGIKFTFWRYGKFLKYRMAGIDLMLEILKIANKKKLGIFLAANKNGLSTWEETASAIKKIFPDLDIDGIDLSYNNFGNWKLEIGNSENYKVIFSSLGAPYQEKFLFSLKSPENGKIRLAMGVGGGFDFLTGKLKRAPILMRKVGLEWLWRLIQEPKYRFKRIFNAVVIFPLKVLINTKK